MLIDFLSQGKIGEGIFFFLSSGQEKGGEPKHARRCIRGIGHIATVGVVGTLEEGLSERAGGGEEERGRSRGAVCVSFVVVLFHCLGGWSRKMMM